MAKTPTWRLAVSLKQLRDQLNKLYPNRSKKSDGTIGDAAHASRKSDHNPWIKDSNKVGVVTAMDITHDTKLGVDCNDLLKKLLDSKDSRIKYIIFNKKIYNAASDFAAKDYNGKNAHMHHLHLSVSEKPKLYDSDKDWDLSTKASSPYILPKQKTQYA